MITFGGTSRSAHTFQSSVEQLVYDSKDGDGEWKWDAECIPDMGYSRFCSSVMIANADKYDESIFVAGGKVTRFEDSDKCEIYSFQQKNG